MNGQGRSVEAAALEAIRDPVVVVDRNGTILYLNKAASDFLSTSNEGAAGLSLWNVWKEGPDELRDRVQNEEAAAGVPDHPQAIGGWNIDVLPAQDHRVLHFRQRVSPAHPRVEVDDHSNPTFTAKEEFVEAVLDNIESGIVACDETGTLRMFNRATRVMHGLPEQALPPDQWASRYDLYSADGKTPLPTEDIPLYRAFCGEIVHNAEIVIAPRDKPPRTLLASGGPLVSRDGRKLGAVVAMHDVTHRKLANLRVSRALRQFRTLFNEAPVAYHEVDIYGVVRRVNRAECRLLGFKREEVIGRPVWEFVAEHLRETSRTAVMEKLAGTRPLEIIEREYRTSAGKVLTCEVHENLIHDNDGCITGIRTTLLDVTHRKWAEQQARTLVREVTAREQAEEASAQILQILERIGDAYMAFDTEWRYTYVNQKAAQLARQPAEALLGRCVWDEFPEAVHTPFYTELQRSLRDQVSIDFENYYAPLGKWFDNTVYPSPSGVAVFYRDITDRKRTQESLERTAAKLARQNAELEAFVYIASHDLQEPLRTIANFTRLLGKRCQGKLDKDGAEFLQYIIDASERLQLMIRDLLALARIGKPAPMNLVSASSIVDLARANLSAAIAESGAVVERTDLPELLANEMHFAQLFQNLIGNAIKYRSQVSPRVIVGAERHSTGWCFSIRDNGRGFDMQYADRVFLPFRRLDDRSSSGTGIGLAICRKVVESRGGRIWVESAPGRGATFFFTVPDTPPEVL